MVFSEHEQSPITQLPRYNLRIQKSFPLHIDNLFTTNSKYESDDAVEAYVEIFHHQ